MYICICNSISEEDIVKQLKAYPEASVQDIFEKLEIGHDCGSCLGIAQSLKMKISTFKGIKKNSSKLEFS